MSRTLMLSLALLAGLATVSSALGSVPRPRLAVRPGLARPGGHVRVVGNAGSCSVGETIVAISHAFPGRAIGAGELSGIVGPHHRFVISGRLRRKVHRGRYLVTARCGGGNLGAVAFVRVR